MGRTSDGASDEFGEYYRRLHDRAVAAAVRLVGDRGTGEDLAAEALARAYAHWGRVRRHPNPDAWLMTVVGRLAIDHVRRATRHPSAEELSMVTRSGGDDPSGDRSALTVDLAEALASLSRRQRDVVVLRHLLDQSEQDVARTLGLSNGAVKNHLHRATTKLRDRLDNGGRVVDLRTDAALLATEANGAGHG